MDTDRISPSPAPGHTHVVRLDAETHDYAVDEWTREGARTATKRGLAVRIADRAIALLPQGLPADGVRLFARAAGEWLDGLREQAQRRIDDAYLAAARRQEAALAAAPPSLSRPERAARMRRVARHTGPAIMGACPISGRPAGFTHEEGEWLDGVVITSSRTLGPTL